MIAGNVEKNPGFLRDRIQVGALFFLGSMAAVYILAWFLLQQVMFSWDVSWLLEASRRLLTGGTYAKDFFENNPPLILYLYFPPVVAAMILHVSVYLTLEIYVYLLVSMMLAVSYFLLQKIFLDDVLMQRIFLVAVAAVTLLFPLYEFGQREHLLLIFSVPYILLLCYRLQENTVDRRLAVMIGLVAGSGFALKPWFLLTWILLEMYYMIRKKSINSLLRSETLALVTIITTYLAVIYLRHPDYLFTVVPFSVRWCYGTDWLPWRWTITHPLAIFSEIMAVLYLILYPASRYKTLTTLLVLALEGFITSYLIQRTNWYYHLVPFFGTCVLLSVVLYCDYVTRMATSLRQSILLGGFALSLLAYEFFFLANISTLLFYQSHLYFIFFGILFTLMQLFLYRKNNSNVASTLKILGLSLCALLLSIYFSVIIYSVEWYRYRFSLTTILLVCLFGLLAPKKLKFEKRLFVFSLGILLFFFPYYYLYLVFDQYSLRDEQLQKLTDSMQMYTAHKSVYMLSTDTLLPNRYLSDSKDVSRFSGFWMLPGLYLDNSSLQRQLDKDFLINMIAEDLSEKTPDFIFVDMKKNKLKFWTYQESHGKAPVYWDFDYLKSFSQNKQFRTAWKSYHYVARIKIDSLSNTFSSPFYDFAVYQRND